MGVGVIVGVEVIVGVGVTLGLGVIVGVCVSVGAWVGEGDGAGRDVLVAGMACPAENARGSEINKLLQPDDTSNKNAHSPAILLDKLIDPIFTAPPTLWDESFRLYII